MALAESTKKRPAGRKSSDDEKNLRPTDTPIELSLVFNTFAAEAASMKSLTDECIVIFPSAMFVMKWADDKFLSSKRATFVLPSEPAMMMLQSTYSRNSPYRDNTNDNMQFVLYEDWKENIVEADQLDEKFILYFENHVSDYRWIGKDSDSGSFLSRLYRKLGPTSTIYCLSPESYLNNASSLLYQCATNKESDLSIPEAVAIPRKGHKETMLFDNTVYAQKLFWKVSHDKDWDEKTAITFLRNDSKALELLGKLEDRWKGNGRMLTQEMAQRVSISLKEKADNFPDWTLRQFCFNQKKISYPRKKARESVKFSEEINFWYKGDYMDPNNIMTVTVSPDGSSWELFDYLDIASQSGNYALYGAGQSLQLPEGTRQFRLLFEKVDGNTGGFVYVDDIRVVVEGTDEPLLVEGYDALDVGGELSHTVTGLMPGTDYVYQVKATDGTLTSLDSPQMAVRTSGESGIGGLADDGGAMVYAVDGKVVVETAGGEPVDVYALSGVRVAAVADGGQRVEVDVPRGVYIVKCGGTVAKVLVGD